MSASTENTPTSLNPNPVQPQPKPPDPPGSFVAVLRSAPATEHPTTQTNRGQKSAYRGKKFIQFNRTENVEMVGPYKYTLIGKFSHGSPPIRDIQTRFAGLGLQGAFQIGLINIKHILIQLTSEEDFMRIWMKQILFQDGYQMRLFKWSPIFCTKIKSSIVPLWVRCICKLLRVDEPTADRTRPSVARVCVEIDLLESRDDEILIGLEESVISQKHLGHSNEVCEGNEYRRPKPNSRVSNAKGSIQYEDELKREEIHRGNQIVDETNIVPHQKAIRIKKSRSENSRAADLKNNLVTMAKSPNFFDPILEELSSKACAKNLSTNDVVNDNAHIQSSPKRNHNPGKDMRLNETSLRSPRVRILEDSTNLHVVINSELRGSKADSGSNLTRVTNEAIQCHITEQAPLLNAQSSSDNIKLGVRLPINNGLDPGFEQNHDELLMISKLM
ncbi:hypothetical protein Pfo_018157 [Paulownia fortunei]|nr:hypothetical protein Pfo_018157 [Paulownia fortunei]